MKGVIPDLLKPLALLAIATALGWMFGDHEGAWVGLALCALSILAWQFMRFFQLLHWARQAPLTGAFVTPSAGGAWGEVYAALHRRGRLMIDQQQQLEELLGRFRQAAEAMPEGVVILDGGRAIEWMNSQAEICLSLSSSSDLGLPITHLMREPEFLDYMAERYPNRPLTLHSRRTPGRTIQIQMAPFAAGRSLMLARDITQIERLETMRRDFVANVSHELRTPLTVVSGFIETLQDGLDDLPRAEVEGFLALAGEQAQRMQDLIRDLLTLSSLETDLPPASERIDVTGLLERVRAEAAALSAGRHAVVLESPGPGSLTGSAGELHSAFGNLANNAVRYSPDGGTILLRWEASENGGASLSVIDRGIGIEAKHLPRLTERFYRVDRSRSRDTGGTGLGLAIVKHVLERHQARLEIESEPGRGSIFRAVFPSSRIPPGIR